MGGDVRAFENAQHLADGDGAGGGRGEAADAPAAVVEAQGFPFPWAVAGQVLRGEQAGVGRILAHLGHDGGGDFAFVEGVGAAVGDFAEGFCQFRVAQQGAGRLG